MRWRTPDGAPFEFPAPPAQRFVVLRMDHVRGGGPPAGYKAWGRWGTREGHATKVCADLNSGATLKETWYWEGGRAEESFYEGGQYLIFDMGADHALDG